jgi:hypothetical protein
MKLHGSSELSRMQLLQRQAVEVRAALDRAAQEATTGLKVDKYKATGGNLARLFTIERMLERNAVYRETISVTEMRLDVMQDGLGRALGWAEQVSVDLLTATNLGDYAGATLHAQTAQRAFLDTVSMLNTRLAGQMLFAGIATDRPALAEGAAMLAQIEGIVAGAPDAATAEALIEDYFAGIGAPNFRDDGYLGALEDLAGAEIADGVRLDYAVRADADELVAASRATPWPRWSPAARSPARRPRKWRCWAPPVGRCSPRARACWSCALESASPRTPSRSRRPSGGPSTRPTTWRGRRSSARTPSSRPRPSRRCRRSLNRCSP